MGQAASRSPQWLCRGWLRVGGGGAAVWGSVSGRTGLGLGLGPQVPPVSPSGDKIVQLIMEYVPLGSLRDYLPKHNVGLARILLFAQQICEVMALGGELRLGSQGLR